MPTNQDRVPDFLSDDPLPYPKGTTRSGYSMLHIQPIVKPWIRDVRQTLARIYMDTPRMVTTSMAVEVLLRLWHSASDEEKVKAAKGDELRTKRKLGRPRGKWEGSGAPPLPKEW